MRARIRHDPMSGVCGETYVHEKKKTSHVAMGRKGRKNCLVTGMIREMRSSVATTVLTNAPGCCMIDNENTPSITINRYCASYALHRCFRNARSVSLGLKDVCSAESVEAGDWRLRMRDRSFLRMRWGTTTGIDGGQEKPSLEREKAGVEKRLEVEYEGSMSSSRALAEEACG